MTNLRTYIPEDRLRALAIGETLPSRVSGSVLFADIAGFTALTDALSESLGSRRGAEEITSNLEAVYTALIAEVQRYGGSVIDFAGDAITCWFNDAHTQAALRAVACGFAMQKAMKAFVISLCPMVK